LIWSPFIHDLVNKSDRFYLSSGEQYSNGIKDSLNKDREHEPIQHGPKFDGIIKCCRSTLEFGFLEVSKTKAASYDTKRLYDARKLVDGMLQGLMHGSDVVEDPAKFLDEHVMVGIQISGNIPIRIGLHSLTPQN
jgi:hypothetical protein